MNNFLRKYFLSYLSDISSILTAVFLYDRIGSWGLVQFSLFSISIRAVSFLIPLNLCGLSFSLTKHIVQNNQEASKNAKIAALLVLCSSIAIFIPLTCLFYFSEPQEIFEDDHVFASVCAFIFSSSLASIPLISFKAQHKFNTAAVFQLISTTLIPLITVFLSENSVADFFYTRSFLLVAASLFVLRGPIFKESVNRSDIKNVKYLLYEGFPKIPSDFLYGFLLFFPVLLILQSGNTQTAAIVAFAISINSLGTYLTSPMQSILLPFLLKESALNENKLKQKVVYGSLFLAFGYLFAVQVFNILFSGKIHSFINKQYIEFYNNFIYFSWAFPGILLFNSLKSVNDSHKKKYINLTACGISLIIFYIGNSLIYFIEPLEKRVFYSFCIAANVLGFISICKK